MLAIVIPYYNITYFGKTLASLSNQTDQRFTVYVGDDASKASPEAVLHTYQNDLSVHYTRFETNLGGTDLVSHWERCMTLINDEAWIMLLGDDDVLEPTCVAAFYKHLGTVKALGIDVVRYATIVIDATGVAISKSFEHPEIEPSTYSYYRKLRKYTRSSLSEHIFSKHAYDTHKFVNFPLAWHTDDLAWLTFSNFKDIYTINSAKVYIRFTNQSISGKRHNLELKQEARFQFFDLLVFKYLSYFSKKQTIAILEAYETVLTEKKGYFFYGTLKIAYERLKIKAVTLAKKILLKFL